jgi:hypothetical protein
MDETLQRRIVIDGRICHTRFDVPAGAVLVAQSRACGARPVLDARHTQCDVAQQVTTWNEGHRVVFL